MLRSDLCDFSDAYIVVKGGITLTKAADRDFIDVRNRCLAFKNDAPFTNSISKINNVLIDIVEDLDIVMRMYNLLEYSKSYSKTTGSLWNYYKDEPNNPPPNNYNTDPITTLDIPLINCEVPLILTWSENCVLTDIETRAASI